MAYADDETGTTAVSATDLPVDTSPREDPSQQPLAWRYILQQSVQPQDRDLLYRYTQAEVGDQGPAAQLMFMEGVVNRWQAAKDTLNPSITLQDVLTGSIPYGKKNVGGAYYYPDVTKRRAQQGLSGEQTAFYDQLFNLLTGDLYTGQAPSNIGNFNTGNASGNVRFAGGPTTASYGGELGGIEGWTMGWAQGQGYQGGPAKLGVGDLPGMPIPPGRGGYQQTAETPSMPSGQMAQPAGGLAGFAGALPGMAAGLASAMPQPQQTRPLSLPPIAQFQPPQMSQQQQQPAQMQAMRPLPPWQQFGNVQNLANLMPLLRPVPQQT